MKAAAVLVAAGAFNVGHAAAQEDVLKISVSLASNSFVVGGLRIAEHAGLFKQRGLDAELTVMENGNATVTALLAGSTHFAVGSPSDGIVARSKGQDIVFVANLYRGHSGAVIISKAAKEKLNLPESASAEERLKALSKLVVASTSATAGYTTVLQRAMQPTGASIDFTFMAQPAMPAALESGAIEAFTSGPPFWGVPIMRGVGELWLAGEDLPADVLPTSSVALQTTKRYADENPEVIKRFRALLEDLKALIQNDPETAKKALSAAYPNLSPEEIDYSFAREGVRWSNFVFSKEDIERELKLQHLSLQLPDILNINPDDLILAQ